MPAGTCRKNVVENSGTTVKNSTVKNRKSSVSYTITYFLLCFARQAWLLWRFGVRQPPESGIQDPGARAGWQTAARSKMRKAKLPNVSLDRDEDGGGGGSAGRWGGDASSY